MHVRAGHVRAGHVRAGHVRAGLTTVEQRTGIGHGGGEVGEVGVCGGRLGCVGGG